MKRHEDTTDNAESPVVPVPLPPVGQGRIKYKQLYEEKCKEFDELQEEHRKWAFANGSLQADARADKIIIDDLRDIVKKHEIVINSFKDIGKKYDLLTHINLCYERWLDNITLAMNKD